MILEHITQQIGKPLPDTYQALLETIDDYCFLCYNEYPDEFPDSHGTSWFFLGKERLAEVSVMLGASKDRQAWDILASYHEIHNKAVVPLVAIAEDEGDLLYLDVTDNFSVWRYMHDSGESRRLAADFDTWLEQATVC